MKKTFLSLRFTCALALPAAAALLLAPPLRAATISLGTSDSGTTSSLTTGTNWTGGAVATAGNDYVVGGGLTIQTPADNAPHTFAGDSLMIGDGGATAATLLEKGTGSSSVLTISNLILNNGIIQAGSGANPFLGPVTGASPVPSTITLLSGGGIIDMHGASNQITILSTVTGSGPLLLENSVGGTPGASALGIVFKGVNTYTGPTTIGANTKVTVNGGNPFAFSSSLSMDASSVMVWTATGTINNLSGAGTINSNLTGTGGGATLTLNQTVDGTFGGSFNYIGAGGTTGTTFNLAKTGAATLTLTGVNTWTGSTATSSVSVLEGVLKLDGSTGSFSSNLALKANGGTFDYDNTHSAGAKSQSFASLSAGIGDSTIQSTLGGASSSTLSFTAFTALAANSGATVNFVVADGANGTTNSIILGGASTGFLGQAMFFNGANYAYEDAGGFVRAAVYGSDAGFVNAGSSLTAASHNRVTSSISSQGAVAVNTIKFDGTNEVDLGLTGLLTLTNDGLLRSGGGATAISGGSIAAAGANANLVIRTDTAADSLAISSTIQNTTGLTNGLLKSGDGTLTLTGVNTYTGNTTIDGGVLSVSQNANLGSAAQGATVVINGGTLRATSTFALNNGAAGNRLVSLANDATIDVTGGNTLTITGAVANNGTFVGNLIKTDTGTLVLSGVNTYSGTTSVNGGTLLVNGSLIAGTAPVTAASAVTVNNSGILGGTGTIGGSLTLASGGAIAPGVIGGIGTLHGASFVWNGGGALDFDLGSGATSDLLNLTGAFTKGGAGTFTFDFNALGGLVAGATYTLVDFGSTTFSASDFLASGASGTFSMNGSNLQFTVSAVPEPGTYGLVALGGIALLALRYRRRSITA